ncbi:hypothetical protein V2G26_008573 [Clonostachys chloroleuca]
MSSSDVRDVLNLSEGASGTRPNKKQRLAAPRPNLKGLAREVHNLGGDNPIAIVPEVTQFKKRRFANRKPASRWEMRSFRNSARNDSTLILKHWRRIEEKQENQGSPAEELKEENGTQEGQAPAQDEMEDSSFAKFNAQVSVPQYSDDQYAQTLTSETWTKDETDYLLDLAKAFDLRWPLIWDRYEWTPPATNGEANENGDESKAIVPLPDTQARTMEDLKARYYEVAAKMMAVQKPVQYMTQPEFALHELMAHFNPEQEKMRKNFALNAFTRSREEAREEESLLLEIKRILARSERFNEERRELYSRLDYPHAETDISSFKSSAGLQTLLGTLMNASSKKRKTLPGPEGASPSNPGPPQAPVQDSGRRESTGPSTGNREPPATGTPTAANKKGQSQTQQPPAERPKLTEKEEAIYGVTHHDRLGSGPTFRTEKINKLFSHKSNQQQLRINNTLNELDVPSKLAMPTSATTLQYEQLLGAVNSLLEARKVSDKLDGEIKIELAKKAEREKANAPPDSENSKAQEDASKENVEKGAVTTAPEAEAASKPDSPDSDDVEEDDAAKNTKATGAQKEEEEDEEEIGVESKAARPGSSGAAQKRSASVLSTASDKSSKRQKK